MVNELCLFCREYFHSFSTNVVAFSAALCLTATGLTVLSYMDELYVLSQVIFFFSVPVNFDYFNRHCFFYCNIITMFLLRGYTILIAYGSRGSSLKLRLRLRVKM